MSKSVVYPSIQRQLLTIQSLSALSDCTPTSEESSRRRRRLACHQVEQLQEHLDTAAGRTTRRVELDARSLLELTGRAVLDAGPQAFMAKTVNGVTVSIQC